MRIKKYKRQPKIYTELYGPEEDKQDALADGKQDIPLGPDGSEESDAAVKRGTEWHQNDPKRNTDEDRDADVELEDQQAERLSQKETEGSTTSGNELLKVDGRDIVAAPAFVPPADFQENKSAEKYTTGTIACSGVPSLTASAANVEGDHVTVKIDDLHRDMDRTNNWGGSSTLASGGSGCFKAERVICFLQILALALDADGASWPPIFAETWGWTWLTTGYMRWPILVLLQRIGRSFSLDLWFSQDMTGYAVEVYTTAIVAFILFFVLQIPDYTNHKPVAAWKRSVLTDWHRRTLPRYVLNLFLCYVVCIVLAYHGSAFFPGEAIKGAVVGCSTILTASWLCLVMLSFAIHVTLRAATKHDFEYSFVIALKSVVKVKGRVCLFVLHIAYIPVTASILRALLPLYDWNDNWARASRRDYNHHVSCYYQGFPPNVDGVIESAFLECASESGVAVNTLSACLLLLFTYGLPNMDRYLVQSLFSAFERNSDVIKSFLQAKQEHQATLHSLAPFPKDAVWLAKRRWEMSILDRAVKKSQKKMRRAVIALVRQISSIRIPQGKSSRRKRKGGVLPGGDSLDTGSSGAAPAESASKGHGYGKDLDGAIAVRLWTPETHKTLDSSFSSGVLDCGTEERLAMHEVAVTSGSAGWKGVLGREDELTRRRRAAAQPSPLSIYLRERKKACIGLPQALLVERDAWTNAANEYVLALSNFEADHSLEITCWESVVDTSGLLYLSESYTWLRPGWKVVESLERCTCVAALIVSRHIGSASTQFLLSALVLAVFQAYTLRAEPYLYLNEAILDSGMRVALILILCIGAGAASGTLGTYFAEALLLAIGASGTLAMLLWCNVIGAVRRATGRVIALVDDRVNDLLFRQITQRSLGLECSQSGLRLLMQWDDLLEQHRWSAFRALPTPTPPSLLSKYEKIFVVRWAAFRGVDIQGARTLTGLSLLHDSIINAEVEATRWLVHLYPMLLDSETLLKESPLLLGMLETARVLLRMEGLVKRIENRDTGAFDSASSQSTSSRGPVVSSGAAEQNEVKGAADEVEELGELRWKIGKLMEIFLSDELQNATIRWNTRQYDLLTEHGEPDIPELAQLLAEAFNFNPPQGYALKHRWRNRAQFIRDYLGEATCAPRTQVLLSSCGLGDIGHQTLVSVCRALSIPATTFTWPSTHTGQFRFGVVKLDLSGNRLRLESGYVIAEMLLLNKSIEDLDISDNMLDSQAASEIFFVLRKNATLKKLNLAQNRIGPEAAEALGTMVLKNRCLTYLDISANQMGEKTHWESMSEFVCIPSAGPTLGESLGLNKTLIELKVNGNLLGADTGEAFANGVAQHHSLTSLDLSGNHILPQGGKALATCLSFPEKSSLTRLDLADNHLGEKAGKLFSLMLKRNRRLRHLDLSRNDLGTQTGIALATALGVNRTLESLKVASNGMGAVVAKAMAKMLTENSSLKTLDLSGNVLGAVTVDGGEPAGEGFVLGHGLRSNKSLTSLSLSGNRLPALEMEHVADGFIDLHSLSHLALAGESLNDAAAREVGDLAASGRLVSLDIARTALAGAGTVTVTRALSTASGLTYLDMSDNSFGEEAARELAKVLAGGVDGGVSPGNLFAVRCLRLARCNLGPTGGALVARALGANSSVEELDLSDNGLGTAAGEALAMSLRVLYRNDREVRPCHMRKLNVSRNPLGNTAGVAILGALINECTQHLDLSYTELRGKEAGRAIGRMLRCHTVVLRYLNVKHNALGRDGANEVFWAIRRNTSLLHLNLSDNDVGPVYGTEADKLEEYGMTSIHSALFLNHTLRLLDLGANGLSAECGMNITASIENNRCLAKLCLESNDLDDQAAISIARKLHWDHQIEHLNLNSNRIGWRGGVELAAALALNNHLTFLDIGNNMLGEGGNFARIGAKICDALTRNKTLTSLNLEGNIVGPTGGLALAEALRRNNSLVYLNLENNRFDQDVGFALEDLLKINSILREVGASVEEIGIDSRATIDDMLASRDKVLERERPPNAQQPHSASAGVTLLGSMTATTTSITRGNQWESDSCSSSSHEQ